MVAVGTREGHRENSNVRSDWRMVNWLLSEEKKKEWKLPLIYLLGLMTLLLTSMGINGRNPNGFPGSPYP